MHRYSFTVAPANDGAGLLRAIRLAYPALPFSYLRRALQERQIKLNGVRQAQNGPVRAGDAVEFFSAWQPMPVPVVFEDEHLIIFNKPAGLNSDETSRSEASLIALARQQAENPQDIFLCHRLDNQTSGLVMAAKSAQARDAVEQAQKLHQIDKYYECLAKGTPQPVQATLHAYWRKDAAAARVTVFAQPQAGTREIITAYQVLIPGEISRLRIRLHTGRTHQIRAHLAFYGYPVLGDDQYGDRAFNRSQHTRQLMLCATRLVFHTKEGLLAPLDGRVLQIDAPF